MPISSPSYFPPQRATDRIIGLNAGIGQTGNRCFLAGLNAGTYTTQPDLVVIGSSALSVGTSASPNNDAAAQYSVIIGSGSAALANVFHSGNDTGPLIILGGNTLAATGEGTDNVAIGANILPSAIAFTQYGLYENVCIGNGIGSKLPANNVAGGGLFHTNVIIGCNSMIGTNGLNWQPSNSIVIGAAAVNNSRLNGTGFGWTDNIIIGYNAAAQFNGAECVIIGSQACPTWDGKGNGVGATSFGCVMIGPYVTAATVAGNTITNAVVMGDHASVTATGATSNSESIAIGPRATSAGGNQVLIGSQFKNYSARSGAFSPTGVDWILIGTDAGNGETATDAGRILIESWNGANSNTMFYGNLYTGSLVLGNSSHGVNRDLPGTNALKLLAGTATGTPVGGGMFYVAGANNDIHWVGSDGVDTNLTSGANGALTYTYNAPLTGFSITVGNDIAQLVLEPAGTLATGTVTLPAAPEDGDTVGISTTQTITALTISPNTGQTVADAPTTLGVGGAVRFLYRATNTTWYRIGN